MYDVHDLILNLIDQLNVSVGGPGLPINLEGETYSCHLEDSMGRFNITVPAMEVTPRTEYTCNITNEVPVYEGVQAGKDNDCTCITTINNCHSVCI